MRVGVYVDGYNLYYGGRKRCGRGEAGWRWLDVRALFDSVVAEQAELWPGARIERLVYCTARISAAYNASGAQDQDVYLKALLAAKSVDYIEYGNYINKVITRPLAVERGGSGKHRRTPVLLNPSGPIKVKVKGEPADDAVFLASVATFEEKGSDVNVATHLLVDMLTDVVDAVVVVSNDSDLHMPVNEAWKRVPVGLVNPGSGYTAGALSTHSGADVGAGPHWWRTLEADDYTAHQLPDPAGRYKPPPGW
ncbi:MULTISPECIES: NYN domain-containing protein [Actinosynnema]|uniref:NYN domain-containing protein n=1 Tax=Actinosynnema TaxID=40566 RepID=UPI0020A31DFA|nr:NYN domain-containing protein [Actinosynnema pretiosum]MCP2093517.1 NYN domain-containing protein [Actinosynnema pretiosum]